MPIAEVLFQLPAVGFETLVQPGVENRLGHSRLPKDLTDDLLVGLAPPVVRLVRSGRTEHPLHCVHQGVVPHAVGVDQGAVDVEQEQSHWKSLPGIRRNA
jgi:hypothetical protein